jgi:hypothetical protein
MKGSGGPYGTIFATFSCHHRQKYSVSCSSCKVSHNGETIDRTWVCESPVWQTAKFCHFTSCSHHEFTRGLRFLPIHSCDNSATVNWTDFLFFIPIIHIRVGPPHESAKHKVSFRQPLPSPLLLLPISNHAVDNN